MTKLNKKWKTTLNFAHFYHDSSISVEEKGKMVAAILQKKFKKELDLAEDFELSDLSWLFTFCTGIAEEGITAEDDFNEQMSRLYDWADSNRIWVNTL